MAAKNFYHQLGNRNSVFATAESLESFIAAPGRGQSEEDYIDELARKYNAGDFLPRYAPGYRFWKLVVPHDRGLISEQVYRARMTQLEEFLSTARFQEISLNDVRAARRLMRRALSLFEVLQDGRKVGKKDLELLGVSCSPVSGETTKYTMRLHIPWGNYLEYINESLSFMTTQPYLYFNDCFFEEQEDPYIGYLGYTGGANLAIANTAANDACSRRMFLIYALSALLDLHLVHMRPLAVGIGDVRLFSFDRVTALWAQLRESATKGRIGRCRTCGAPFIAGKERGRRRAYCSDSCKRKYLRTIKVLEDIEGGKDPMQAAKGRSISIKSVADIAEQNGLLKKGVNYGFGQEGGDQQ